MVLDDGSLHVGYPRLAAQLRAGLVASLRFGAAVATLGGLVCFGCTLELCNRILTDGVDALIHARVVDLRARTVIRRQHAVAHLKV